MQTSTYALILTILASSVPVVLLMLRLAELHQQGVVWATAALLLVWTGMVFLAGFGCALLASAWSIVFNQRDNERLVMMLRTMLENDSQQPFIPTPQISPTLQSTTTSVVAGDIEEDYLVMTPDAIREMAQF